MYSVIIDCYTDEPSGLSVPPYIGTYQRYLSQALTDKSENHYYITIDDLRYANNNSCQDIDNPKRTINTTKNKNNVLNILANASHIYIVMGCFISYDYFACLPPSENELYELMKNIKQKITLFYVLGIRQSVSQSFYSTKLYAKINDLVLGNPYNYILNGVSDDYDSDYHNLGKITKNRCVVLEQLERPYIVEIETSKGCNHGKCSFCIEAMRKTPTESRPVDDIIEEIINLYNTGARHFRFGKQPNFYYYMQQDVSSYCRLFSTIREKCPDIKTLHIDNVNAEDVITPQGREITEILVRFGSSGNITNFGVESFDPMVRKLNRLNGTITDTMKAIELINQMGNIAGADGLPVLLPGINLLYGLPGQTRKTFDYNIQYLNQIKDQGLLMRRLFLRRITNPFGNYFGLIGGKKDADEDFRYQNDRIIQDFVLPMQEQVYGIGSVIRGLEEIIWIGDDTHIRKLGTCAERFIVKNRHLDFNKEFDIQIIAHEGPRKMIGVVVE